MTPAQALRWLAKLPVTDQKTLIDGLYGDSTYERLIERISKERQEELRFHSKEATPEAAQKIAERREARLRDSAPKRKKPAQKQKLITGQYFLFIRDCRNRGISWEAIANELKRKRFKVTPRYLKETYTAALEVYGIAS